jgi:hypothetical protein
MTIEACSSDVLAENFLTYKDARQDDVALRTCCGIDEMMLLKSVVRNTSSDIELDCRIMASNT